MEFPRAFSGHKKTSVPIAWVYGYSIQIVYSYNYNKHDCHVTVLYSQVDLDLGYGHERMTSRIPGTVDICIILSPAVPEGPKVKATLSTEKAFF